MKCLGYKNSGTRSINSLFGIVFNHEKKSIIMKKIALYSLLACALFAFTQCKNSKKAAKQVAETAEVQGIEGDEAIAPVMVDEPSVPPTNDPKVLLPVKVYANYVQEKTDPYTLLGTRVSGDTLFVNVQYGGGCEEHQFTLNTTGAWMKSMPPQLLLYLDHKANNDLCRALITKEIAFDLSKTRYPGAKEVRLIINDNREQSVVYKY
jgi:hypothetical protein